MLEIKGQVKAKDVGRMKIDIDGMEDLGSNKQTVVPDFTLFHRFLPSFSKLIEMTEAAEPKYPSMNDTVKPEAITVAPVTAQPAPERKSYQVRALVCFRHIFRCTLLQL